MKTAKLLRCVVIVVVFLVPLRAEEIYWSPVAPDPQNWSQAANWWPGGAMPGTTSQVVIGPSSPYSPQLSASASVDSVRMWQNTLEVLAGGSLTSSSIKLAGAPDGTGAGYLVIGAGGTVTTPGLTLGSSWSPSFVDISGTLALPAASGLDTSNGIITVHTGGTISLASDATFTGNGTLQLQGGSIGGGTLTNASYIQGYGTLNMGSLTNEVEIDGVDLMVPGTITNNGSLSAGFVGGGGTVVNTGSFGFTMLAGHADGSTVLTNQSGAAIFAASSIVTNAPGVDVRIQDDGFFVLHNPGFGTGLAVAGGARLVLEGTGTLYMDSGLPIGVAPGSFGGALVNGAGHTIQGIGAMQGLELTNAGNILHETPGGMLTLAPAGSFQNSGRISAANGGQMLLDLSAGSFTNSGTLNVNNSFVTVAGLDNIHTFANAAGGSVTLGPGALSLLATGPTVITNDGSIALAPSAQLVLGAAQYMLGGAGSVDLNGTIIGSYPDGLTIGSGQTVSTSGTGRIRQFNSLENQGHLSSAAGANLTIQAGSMSNPGVLTTAGTTTVTTTLLSNSGQIEVACGGSLQVNGAVRNSGTFQVGACGTAAVSGKYTQQGASSVTDVDGSLTAPELYFQQGRLMGAGNIHGNVRVGGRVTVGHSPGRMDITGDFLLDPEGTVEMEIGPDAFDQLFITGQADFLGTLLIQFLDGFTYQPGRSYDLFSWGSLGTAFSPGNIRYEGLSGEARFNPFTGDLTLGAGDTAAPEPGSCVLLLAGLAGLLWRRYDCTRRTCAPTRASFSSIFS